MSAHFLGYATTTHEGSVEVRVPLSTSGAAKGEHEQATEDAAAREAGGGEGKAEVAVASVNATRSYMRYDSRYPAPLSASDAERDQFRDDDWPDVLAHLQREAANATGPSSVPFDRITGWQLRFALKRLREFADTAMGNAQENGVLGVRNAKLQDELRDLRHDLATSKIAEEAALDLSKRYRGDRDTALAEAARLRG